MTSDPADELLRPLTTQPPAAPAPFPEAAGRTKGYDKAAVDAFLAAARNAFEDVPPPGGHERLSSATVRTISFPLVRRGYAVAPVDAALGRIEDAFAVREREDAVTRAGASAWVGHVRGDAQVLLDRLARGRGRRFRRTGWLRFGYRVDEVDLVCERLIGYFEQGEPVTVDQVRQAAFRMQRAGYREEQVDAVLDAVVEVMLAVR